MKVLFLLLLAFSLQAEILETPRFKDLLQHAENDTLVILDIDDTLLVPKQTLGSDVWFCYQLNKNKHAPDPLDKTLAEWEAIRHLSQMEIVEEGTEEIVQSLQNRRITLMGLTTQGLALATRTTHQLQYESIDLSKTAPGEEDLYFTNVDGRGILYRKGVLFTSGSPKGPALEKLLDLLQLRPKKVLFINDKRSHLLDVESSMIQRNIPFIGLRYSYSDSRVASFQPELAEIQFTRSHFGYILSDAEAKALLEAHASP